MTTEKIIIDILAKQRLFFQTGATRQYETRIECLKKLKSGLMKYEPEFHGALKKELGKSEFEAYITETGFCLHELSFTIKNLKKWMKDRRKRTPLLSQPGKSMTHYEPMGPTLIISPYNYPVTLTFSPLTTAIAAGNTAVLKTSELTPACNRVIERFIEDTFDPQYIAFVSGEIEETTILLSQKFDHIFFSGSPRVGSIVMKAAAENLTPVTLELGGKNPCIVHKDANLNIAVKRIVMGKFLNAGQTCVAPDFILVHRKIKEKFIRGLKRQIILSYGDDASMSPDYGRIVNKRHFDRILNLIDPGKIVVGGQADPKEKFIAPTVLRDVTLSDKVMTEEIFGPVLPVLDYDCFDNIQYITSKMPEHPLACYIFSESQSFQNEIISKLKFGGGCINNCVLHIGNPHLPFGGIGESGIGSYHGFNGFKRFSHEKSILKSATILDIPLIYAPYGKKLKLLRKILK